VTAESAAPRGRGIVDVDGARLRYYIEGRGPACLVIGSSVFYPRTFSQELAQQV